ncbi:oxygen-insensitive NADPH nitroreductase [Metabacillus bambusae]|uniref:Oxygen-insensitive NADPH nitroreductase n=1 Tax=Metabacillus bambusae TaxID=2795218 RepID=A0ABS3N3C6_9BACI|nr:oxygen-insensitive NADPH nitroreductase [Metabacillus bambusae]MBO1512733.1 oxygen-insensitive NADPH nitroreductase [Metabacillus bambusae]
MNKVIETILDHRSIRKFEDKLLTDVQIKTIVQSAQAASTSSFVQAYSIIGVKDKQKKARLAELAGGQTYVAENGHFFVFCADLYRHQVIAETNDQDAGEVLESTEKFMVAVIDATLAAQNAVLAAESMGLGAVYIGGLRNQLNEVCDVLKTPARVLPLFGVAVGYPVHKPDQKQRLPIEHIYHEDEYEQDKAEYLAQLEQYDQAISTYYEKRTNGQRKDTWTGQMAGLLARPTRMYMKEFVENKGFNKR